MNDFLDFARWFVAVSLLFGACAAAWRGVSRYYAPRAEIRRLTAREIELAAELTRQRERHFELVTARDFADSAAAGYIDRTGLE